MKLYIKCDNCKSDISFWTWASDRVALKKENGDKIELACKKCNHVKRYYINDLRARESKLALLLALIIFIVGTPILFFQFWDYIWEAGIYGVLPILIVIMIPSFIYGIINKNEAQRVRLFNRS